MTPRDFIFCFVLATGAPLAHAADDSLPAYEPHAVTLPKAAPYVQADGSILIVGNDGMEPMLRQFNELFTRTHPGFTFTLLCRGSSTGIGGLTAGVSAFGPMGRGAWPVELEPFRRLYGYAPTDIRIGRDGYSAPSRKNPPAVYVNARNPLKSLTMAQVARIFTTGAADGDLSHWNQVMRGGAERVIHPYGPRDDGGSATALRNDFMGDLPFNRRYEALAKSADVLRAIADDVNGIGLTGYIDAAAVTPEVRLVALAVDDEAQPALPDYETVLAGRYPLTPFMHLYVNRAPGQPLDPFVKEYARLVLSREGQAIIAALRGSEEGYIPLTPAEVAAERAKLE
jgi:phosphate transport system substrate-binding protein